MAEGSSVEEHWQMHPEPHVHLRRPAACIMGVVLLSRARTRQHNVRVIMLPALALTGCTDCSALVRSFSHVQQP
jgi:hypothetical protein